MKAAAILAISSLAATASAGAIFYSEPISSTTWTLGGGDTFTVSWTSGCDVTDNNVYDIALNIQNNGLQVSAGIAPIGKLDCSEKEGSTTVTIPETVASGNQYSILVVNGNGLQSSYSALFNIVNPAIPAPAGNATTTATAPATTVANTTTAPLPTTTAAGNATATTVSGNSTTTPTGKTTSVTQVPTNKPVSAASSLKVGSTAALLIVAAVGLML